MRLAIFGATGRTGVELVGQALDRGHEVTALARSTARAGAALPASPRLTVVEGDLLDTVAVDKTVAGADAVVNVTGHVQGSPTDLQRRAIAAILPAMRAHGVQRLVTLTGAGVRAEGDQPKLVDKVFHLALSKLQPELLADSQAYVDLVRGSGLRWTVVRAPRLTGGAPAGSYRVAANVGAGTGTRVDRADLATFILDELEQERFVGAHPVVSAPSAVRVR